MELVLCQSCRRHVRVGSARCPFCDATFAETRSAAGRGKRAAAALVSVGFAALCCACYGPPPRDIQEPPTGEPDVIEGPQPDPQRSEVTVQSPPEELEHPPTAAEPEFAQPP